MPDHFQTSTRCPISKATILTASAFFILMLGNVHAQAPSQQSKSNHTPPRDAKSLEQFVDRCHREGIQFKLSLKQLAYEWREGNKVGSIPQDVENCHRFTWFFGFVVDRKNNDVLLLGLQNPSRPPISIDCLATAFRAVNNREVPYCSLDPHPDRDRQKTVIGGIEWNTRWAEIMVDADYSMKRIALGSDANAQSLLHKHEFKSWFRHEYESAIHGLPANTSKANRWWFSRKDEPRTIAIDTSDEEPADLVIINKNPVVVLTEAQKDGHFGSGDVDEQADIFAKTLTGKLELIAPDAPKIASLLSLYRILDLAVHIKTLAKVEVPCKDFWLTQYQGQYKGPPETYPTLDRTDSIFSNNYQIQLKVVGGVSMPLSPSQSQNIILNNKLSLKDKVLMNYEAKEVLTVYGTKYSETKQYEGTWKSIEHGIIGHRPASNRTSDNDTYSMVFTDRTVILHSLSKCIFTGSCSMNNDSDQVICVIDDKNNCHKYVIIKRLNDKIITVYYHNNGRRPVTRYDDGLNYIYLKR